MKEATEIKSYLESGYNIVQLESWEEDRALEYARAVAGRLKWPAYVWSAANGFGDHQGPGPADPWDALRRVEADERPGLFVFLDFHHALKDPAVDRVHYGWSEFLTLPVLNMDVETMRRSERTGRPLGEKEFGHGLGQQLGRKLEPGKGGRPKKEPKS